jgi:hypothetical protein
LWGGIKNERLSVLSGWYGKVQKKKEKNQKRLK